MLEDIDNIVLFVGDAVRYDSANSQLAEIGRTHKSIAGSLHTPASFGSILTGRDVPSHGITGFRNQLPEESKSLCNLEGFNCAFSPKTGTMHEDLIRMFHLERQEALSDIEEPFVWIVRDPGGHAPYNGYDGETYEQHEETATEYFERVAGNRPQILGDYEKGVNDSLQRFRSAVKTVRERGIEDRTLLIYTSDHGELLGEYGLLGHNHVACPELVYVPTTFVHPDIPAGNTKELIRHVDLFPTILETLGASLERSETDRIPIQEEYASVGLNHFEMVFYNSGLMDNISLKVQSCWDKDGGHSFIESSYLDSIAVYLGLLLKSEKGDHIVKERSFIETLKVLLPGHRKYGNPGFDEEFAKSHLEHASYETGIQNQTELDSDTKERLDDLGYI